MPWPDGMAWFTGYHPFIRRRYLLLSPGRGVYDANRRFYSGQLNDFLGILEPTYLAQVRIIDRMARPPCAASLEYLTSFFEFATHSIGSHLGIFCDGFRTCDQNSPIQGVISGIQVCPYAENLIATRRRPQWDGVRHK